MRMWMWMRMQTHKERLSIDEQFQVLGLNC